MGTDIFAYVERRSPDHTWRYAGDAFPDNEHPRDRHCPFNGAHSYSLFGFLADIRNYSNAPVIAQPRGLPADVSSEVRSKSESYGYGKSWLTLAELQAFDYDETFTDQREDPPKVTTVRDFLGDWYFERLALLDKLGDPEDVRIVFWFDS